MAQDDLDTLKTEAFALRAQLSAKPNLGTLARDYLQRFEDDRDLQQARHLGFDLNLDESGKTALARALGAIREAATLEPGHTLNELPHGTQIELMNLSLTVAFAEALTEGRVGRDLFYKRLPAFPAADFAPGRAEVTIGEIQDEIDKPDGLRDRIKAELSLRSMNANIRTREYKARKHAPAGVAAA